MYDTLSFVNLQSDWHKMTFSFCILCKINMIMKLTDDNNIKNIIFDLGGVIINIDMMSCLKRIEALGVPVKEMMSAQKSGGATVCEGMSVSGPMELYQLGKISTQDFFNGFLRYCHEGTTLEQLEDAWNSCLLSIPEERLKVIKSLRSRYNVYMLSNTNDCHWRYIEDKYFKAEGHTTDIFFDRVFLSHEMHLAKPDYRIYEQVLKEIDAKGEECLFIDDAKANLDAAKECGIRTLQAADGWELANVEL